MHGHVAESSSALPKRRGARLAAAATTVGMLAATPVLAPAVATPRVVHAQPQLSATVYTVDGLLAGLVGGVTNSELQGSVCTVPNTCIPVRYPALPGAFFVGQGAAALKDRIANTTGEMIGFGHSEGGEVVYQVIREYSANPSTAPDPSRITFITTGNPERKYGGVPWIGFTNPQHGIPDDTPYQVTDIARQYDGWADWPTNSWNPIAVANAIAGIFSLHNNYNDVNPDDPTNIRWTEGNVTYVLVPTKLLPLIAWTGPFAQALDNMLRPIVESAYNRPVPVTPSAGAETADSTEITATAETTPDATTDTTVVRALNRSQSLKAAEATADDSTPAAEETSTGSATEETDKTAAGTDKSLGGNESEGTETDIDSEKESTKASEESEDSSTDDVKADETKSESESTESSSKETKSEDTTSTETKSTESKTSETKSTDSKSGDSSGSESSSAKSTAGSSAG